MSEEENNDKQEPKKDDLGLDLPNKAKHDDHDHGHDHSHDEEPEIVEDSGTRALSAALSSSFFFVRILVIILCLGFFLSCIRSVEPGEQAVILRFGKPVISDGSPVLNPGLHFAFPYPIDEVVSIPVGESLSAQSWTGWFSFDDADLEHVPRGEVEVLDPGVHGYTLSADRNIMHVRATVKYRIDDAVKYAFNYENVTEMVTNMLNNAVLYASSRHTVADTLYADKEAFQATVDRRVDKQIREMGLGIKVEGSVSLDRRAPLNVESFFERVQESEQDRANMIDKAEGYRDQTTRKAEGEAQAIISMAMSHSNQTVRAVAAEAAYFNDALPHFTANPELYRARVVIEATQTVLTNATDIFYLNSSDPNLPTELRLDLSRIPVKPVAVR